MTIVPKMFSEFGGRNSNPSKHMMPLFGLFLYPNLTTHHSEYRWMFKMSDPIRHAELTSQILPQLSPAQFPQLQGHISHSRTLRLCGWLPQSKVQPPS